MGVRLNKVLNELNIGLQTAVDFLKAHKELGDIKDDASPNTKIWDSQYEALVKEFSRKEEEKRMNTFFLQPKKYKAGPKYAHLSKEPILDIKPLGKIDLDKLGKKEDSNSKQEVKPVNEMDLDSPDSKNRADGKTSNISESTAFEYKTDSEIIRSDKSNVANNNAVSSSNNKYDVFVSYSRIDTNRVQAIVEEIERKGYKVWIDKKGIDSGDEFKTTIVKAIRNSEAFLFFSSKGANESTWTMKEVNTAVHFKKVIIPVKLDNTEYDDSILMELVGLDYVDFTSSSQHSYAISKLTKALQKRISHSTDNKRK